MSGLGGGKGGGEEEGRIVSEQIVCEDCPP